MDTFTVKAGTLVRAYGVDGKDYGEVTLKADFVADDSALDVSPSGETGRVWLLKNKDGRRIVYTAVDCHKCKDRGILHFERSMKICPCQVKKTPPKK